LLAALSARAAEPVFPYGAVYFRKSNPPEAAGPAIMPPRRAPAMNTFRHWFMWSAIEVAPGKYDWRDYDRMMDLAEQNGIKVVIAELVTAAPEWEFERYPHARFKGSDDSMTNGGISSSSAPGGFPGLCLGALQREIAFTPESARPPGLPRPSAGTAFPGKGT